ncbi:MAG: hypothetical protein JWP14_2125, partial [Frankiales bacterium]|nr:hypothetical protein [Frankiales bacterium]
AEVLQPELAQRRLGEPTGQRHTAGNARQTGLEE